MTAPLDIADADGVTPMMKAARDNDSSAIAEMVMHGHDVNAKDNSGNSALIYAANSGSEEAALMLMFHKADLTAANPQGQTALIIAAANKMQPVVERWAVMQGPLDAQERQGGRTALMTAIAARDAWAACRLVDGGADFEKLADKKGDTGFTLAKLVFTGEDLGFFMHAVTQRRAAQTAENTARARHENDVAQGAAGLTGPVTAPRTASFRKKAGPPLN